MIALNRCKERLEALRARVAAKGRATPILGVAKGVPVQAVAGDHSVQSALQCLAAP